MTQASLASLLPRLALPLILAFITQPRGAGGARLSWQMDSLSQGWTHHHGPLMISAFLGMPLCLRRAVALESRYRGSIAIPLINPIGALALLLAEQYLKH